MKIAIFISIIILVYVVIQIYNSRNSSSPKLIDLQKDIGQLVSNMQVMLNSKKDDHFFIINCGNYYVQYIQGESDNYVYCESIGGEFLKNFVHETSEIDREFKKINFFMPYDNNGYATDGTENYSKIYDLNHNSLEDIINEAIFIFKEVYKLPDVSNATYDLNS